MFGLSPSEMLIVGVVAILLFGSRLPTVARSMGKSLTEFRRGMQDLQHEFRDAMHEADQAAKSPVPGAQGRLSGPAAVAHDDGSQSDPLPARDDSASDTAYDTREPYPEETAEAEGDPDASVANAGDPDAIDRRETVPSATTKSNG